MITSIKVELTWSGKVGKAVGTTSEKKIRQMLKDMTGAEDVEIVEVECWDEEPQAMKNSYLNGFVGRIRHSLLMRK